jgi:hypothetical protein
MNSEEKELIKITMKSLDKVSAEDIINNRQKMVQFLLQTVMILPQTKDFISEQGFKTE